MDGIMVSVLHGQAIGVPAADGQVNDFGM
jgi:hypothetical protein